MQAVIRVRDTVMEPHIQTRASTTVDQCIIAAAARITTTAA
ncbi:hypothetical protein [Burkholderia sp. AU15512]|nr:hypothetical protein [Burkholderia sp. AU15512]